LHHNFTSTFQVIGNCLPRSKAKLKYHQNLTDSKGHHTTYFYQITPISGQYRLFSYRKNIQIQTDVQTHDVDAIITILVSPG